MDGAGVLAGAWHKAGPKVGSAPWNISAEDTANLETWPPWDIPSLSCPAGHRLKCFNLDGEVDI